ncbi:MAG: hypothetical protein OSA22_02860 [Aquiluna sp.]|nr:hypothetical protein [Aquiluna sp.]
MQPADETAITKPSVVPGLGYPNQRDELSPEPTGWKHTYSHDIEHVSRETSTGGDHE